MITVRARLIIIQNNKILLTYSGPHKFYYFIGGKVEHKETIMDAAVREVREEVDATFTPEKIVYIRDFFSKVDDIHAVEFYIYGSIDKGEELHMYADPENKGAHHAEWIPLSGLLEKDVRPKVLAERIVTEYDGGFDQETEYVGAV